MVPADDLPLMAAALTPPVHDAGVLTQGVLVFVIAGILMVLVALLGGGLLRRRIEMPSKGQPYECGEATIGTAWVQFDLRFYVVGLVFVIADVAMVLFYPWAVIQKRAGLPAIAVFVMFFGVLAVGYAYLWRFGYLDWAKGKQRG